MSKQKVTTKKENKTKFVCVSLAKQMAVSDAAAGSHLGNCI